MLTNLFKKRDLIAGLGVMGLLGFSNIAQASLTNDLELYYNFDSDQITSGGFTDFSGNNRDGSPLLTGADLSFSTDVAGALGSGNSLNLATAGTDYVVAGWNGVGGTTTDRTVAMWVKTGTSGNGDILAEWGANNSGERFTFRLENSGTQSGASQIGGLRTEIQSDYRTSTAGQPNVADNSWNHVATVYDYNTLGLLEEVTMYVNGVAVASYNDNTASIGINTSTANPVTLGGGALSSSRIIEGNIDDVGIWSRALTGAEVASLASGADVIVNLASTDFNDTVKSGSSQTMTGVDWDTASGVSANSSVTTTANNNAGYFTTGFGATGFAPDQNIENEGPWTATFELTLDPGTTGTLTAVVFDYASLTNSGAPQGSFRAQNFDVLVNGVAFDDQKTTITKDGTLAFSDAAVLNSGLNQITVTAAGIVTTGWNMGIDNLAFYGEVVPEPSSIAILGLGGLLIARRRRR